MIQLDNETADWFVVVYISYFQAEKWDDDPFESTNDGARTAKSALRSASQRAHCFFSDIRKIHHLWTGWWFGTVEFYGFPFSWECHHPN